MTSFLSFAREMKLEISDFSCDAIGQVDLIDNDYRFTHIDLYPKVYIHDESDRYKAGKTMAKTHKHNLITRSINAVVFYHSEILPKEEHPGMRIEEGSYEIVY